MERKRFRWFTFLCKEMARAMRLHEAKVVGVNRRDKTMTVSFGENSFFPDGAIVGSSVTIDMEHDGRVVDLLGEVEQFLIDANEDGELLGKVRDAMSVGICW